MNNLQIPDSTVFLNGDFVPAGDATVSVYDRGFLFADGVYEVIPVYDGKLFELTAHLQRLANSLAAVKINNPYSDTEWKQFLVRLVATNGNGDQSVYLQVTRGAAIRDHAFPASSEATVFAMSSPLTAVADSVLENGINAITLEDNRWLRCDIKSIALLGNVLLRQQAVEAGATESILLRDGFATEGAASNLFIVKNNTLMTPVKSHLILPGITRDVVLDLARNNGIECRETNLTEQALRNADEIWMTSSTKAILPVTRLDDHQVGSGKPGPIWKLLHEKYQQYIRASGTND